jgi:type II secretory pathway pseudopilin PulG
MNTEVSKLEKLKKCEGFTLIETLLALGIMGFLVMTILSGFTQQQLMNKNTSSKNIAISLAESKLEELMKFPASYLTIGASTDYVVVKQNSFQSHLTEQDAANEFKRTWDINLEGTLMEIKITVEYGTKKGGSYPFKITLTTQRGE